jgi:antirestriction protein
MTREISNSEDIIDSRDVIERIAELTEDEDRTEDETEELEALSALADNAEGYAPDWRYGETLIRDSYFVTYAQELADDIGAIDSKASWPLTCIDWEQAARDLRMDYTAVDFGGVTYWVR